MTKLLNKYKEIKRTKKGFTLVELLVVIAILAVLASVSVVGYLGFTTKARNSNAMTELAQVREVIRAELIDGDTNYYSLTVDTNSPVKVTKADEVTESVYTATTDNTVTNGFIISYNSSSSSKALSFSSKTGGTTSYSVTWDSLFDFLFDDLSDLKGTLYVDVGTENTTTKINTITSIAYVTEAGGTALWTVATDALDSGKGNTASGSASTSNANNAISYSAPTTGGDTSGSGQGEGD